MISDFKGMGLGKLIRLHIYNVAPYFICKIYYVYNAILFISLTNRKVLVCTLFQYPVVHVIVYALMLVLQVWWDSLLLQLTHGFCSMEEKWILLLNFMHQLNIHFFIEIISSQCNDGICALQIGNISSQVLNSGLCLLTDNIYINGSIWGKNLELS